MIHMCVVVKGYSRIEYPSGGRAASYNLFGWWLHFCQYSWWFLSHFLIFLLVGGGVEKHVPPPPPGI